MRLLLSLDTYVECGMWNIVSFELQNYPYIGGIRAKSGTSFSLDAYVECGMWNIVTFELQNFPYIGGIRHKSGTSLHTTTPLSPSPLSLPLCAGLYSVTLKFHGKLLSRTIISRMYLASTSENYLLQDAR